MKVTKQRRALTRALHDVTFSLLGLLELHNADPELVEATGEVLTLVIHSHLHGTGSRREQATMPLRRLVGELGAEAAA